MYRNTWMEINLDAIVSNIHKTKEICKKKYIAVLKADAYGCGDIQVAKACIDSGVDMIAVSSLDEAMMLRNNHYNGKLLILGATNVKDIPTIIQNKISIAGFSPEWAEQVSHTNCKGLLVHFAVDTGMNRLGFKDIDSLKNAFQLLVSKGCVPEGIFTHFCCTNETDNVMTNLQFHRFRRTVEALNFPFKWIHCDNSDATIFFKDDISNACRVGISLYGISSYTNALTKAISLYTEVFMTKHVPSNEVIGYGATYTTKQDEIIATCPIGYADGFIRHNQGRKVYVDGMYCEVVGRICMDQCMIRLDRDVKPGTKVEIFGPHIALEEMAAELDTIPYEILCLITDRVTRKYIYHNQELSEENPRLVKSNRTA